MFVGDGVKKFPQAGFGELQQGGILHEDSIFGGVTAEIKWNQCDSPFHLHSCLPKMFIYAQDFTAENSDDRTESISPQTTGEYYG